mgnify:FL=1
MNKKLKVITFIDRLYSSGKITKRVTLFLRDKVKKGVMVNKIFSSIKQLIRKREPLTIKNIFKKRENKVKPELEKLYKTLEENQKKVNDLNKEQQKILKKIHKVNQQKIKTNLHKSIVENLKTMKTSKEDQKKIKKLFIEQQKILKKIDPHLYKSFVENQEIMKTPNDERVRFLDNIKNVNRVIIEKIEQQLENVGNIQKLHETKEKEITPDYTLVKSSLESYFCSYKLNMSLNQKTKFYTDTLNEKFDVFHKIIKNELEKNENIKFNISLIMTLEKPQKENKIIKK